MNVNNFLTYNSSEFSPILKSLAFYFLKARINNQAISLSKPCVKYSVISLYSSTF